MNNLAEQQEQTNVITPAEASEYDFIICIDQSGSMASPSPTMKGKNLWEEAEEFTVGLAHFADKVDDDGLTVITFNSNVDVVDGVHAADVAKVFKEHTPMGGTATNKALDAAFKKHFSIGKPSIVFVLTDGQPNDPDAVADSIIEATKKISKNEELAIQFIQLGDDKGAAKFLTSLDDDLEAKGAKFDIVNALPREEAEGYTIEQLLWLAIND